VAAPDRWNVLASFPVADESDWLSHAANFAAAFVAPAKRERWAELLARRPRRVHQNSHKLHSDLDRRTCRSVAELPAVVCGGGLFYAFADVPRVVPVERAALVADGLDAVYSLVPGKLAVYFFHEGEVWLCRA
jgi:hypothetical protein